MVQNRKQALLLPLSINVEPGTTLVHAGVYQGGIVIEGKVEEKGKEENRGRD